MRGSWPIEFSYIQSTYKPIYNSFYPYTLFFNLHVVHLLIHDQGWRPRLVGWPRTTCWHPCPDGVPSEWELQQLLNIVYNIFLYLHPPGPNACTHGPAERAHNSLELGSPVATSINACTLAAWPAVQSHSAASASVAFLLFVAPSSRLASPNWQPRLPAGHRKQQGTPASVRQGSH